MGTWEAVSLANTFRPSFTRAAEVSSQEDSIPNTRLSITDPLVLLHDFRGIDKAETLFTQGRHDLDQGGKGDLLEMADTHRQALAPRPLRQLLQLLLDGGLFLHIVEED